VDRDRLTGGSQLDPLSGPDRGGGHAQLSIPTVRDRIVQAAAKVVLEPIFEADTLMQSCDVLGRWPASKAMQHARDRTCRLTLRSRPLLPVEVLVDDVNRFLRGWSA